MAVKKVQPVQIKVNTGTFKGSIYSQVVGVTVTDTDLTLEFIYINPRDKAQGEVVSRVTLPQTSGVDLGKTILNTVEIHGKNKKGKQDD